MIKNNFQDAIALAPNGKGIAGSGRDQPDAETAAHGIQAIHQCQNRSGLGSRRRRIGGLRVVLFVNGAPDDSG